VQKELDAPDNALFQPHRRKILGLYVIGDAAKLVTITRIAHRREVYE
jgi:hypothetical protein